MNWGAIGRTALASTLAMLALALPCHALNTTGFDHSPDISDRRDYTFADELKLFNPARDVLVKLGGQASANGFPFFCSTFRPFKSNFAQIGQALARAKSLEQILGGAANLPDAPATTDLKLTDVDACGGAKATLMGKIDESIAKLQSQRAELLAAYRDLDQEIYATTKALRAAKPAVGDLLNPGCAKARNQALSALNTADNEILYMDGEITGTISMLRRRSEKIFMMSCGSALK
jgi:hypothetical protein